MSPFYLFANVFFLASLLFHIVLIFFTPPDFLTPDLATEEPAQAKQAPLQITLMDGTQQRGHTLADHDTNAGMQSSVAEQLKVDPDKWGELLDRLENNKNLTSAFKQKYEDFQPENSTSESYIYRDRQHENIVVKEVFPTIYTIEQNFTDVLKAAPKDLKDHNERNEIIHDFQAREKGTLVTSALKIKLVEKPVDTQQSPLDFPPSARTQYFDETLALPKEKQLTNFVQRYFSYDPNKGDLPIATRELYYDNLQRIAYIFSSDPTYFFIDYFLENLNKEDFLKISLYQAAQLDSTKTQTELLFAIEDIYQIQQRAWSYYYNFEQLKEHLPEQKKNRLRNETLRRVQARYQKVLKDKNINSYNDIVKLYSTKRLEIIDYILQHTPDDYRRYDALFEQANINWQFGMMTNSKEKKALAIQQWLAIPTDNKTINNGDDFLNQKVLQQLTPALNNYIVSDEALHNALQTQIQLILNQRNQQRLLAKQEREKKLLWP